MIHEEWGRCTRWTEESNTRGLWEADGVNIHSRMVPIHHVILHDINGMLSDACKCVSYLITLLAIMNMITLRGHARSSC
jgi:hypothetical protein